MAIEMGEIVRSHLSGIQSIANAEISMVRKVAEAGMDENQRKMCKLFSDHLARIEAKEKARVAKESKPKINRSFCPQCCKLHPSTKQQLNPTD